MESGHTWVASRRGAAAMGRVSVLGVRLFYSLPLSFDLLSDSRGLTNQAFHVSYFPSLSSQDPLELQEDG